jgi:putative oxidoreductase
MKTVVLFGRIFFSLIFLNTIFGHFTQQGIGYAAASGVPYPNILVPVSGVMAILGGLSIVLGYKAKIGAWLLVLFLIPVNFMMHNFWAFEGAEAQTQMVNFIKNFSLIGGALLITYFGAGPMSIDNLIAKRSAYNAESSKRQKFQPTFSREYNSESERISSDRIKEKKIREKE